MVLLVVAIHKGIVVVNKSLSDILLEAITFVELASQPCLSLAFTLPYPLLDLAMNLP